MSWQTINEILTQAMVDPNFARRLLADPISTIREYGFTITEAEEEVLRHANVSDISELSQILVERFSESEKPD